MAIGASIKAYFGGDTSGLRAAVGDANRLVAGFQHEVKKAGVSFGRGLGLGAFIFQAKQLAMEAVEAAQKTRDEFDNVGKSVDNATRTLALFGDGLTSVKKLAVDSVGFLVSGFTQLGDLIGSGINRLRGITESQENLAASAATAAIKAEENLAKARELNSPEKIAAAEQKLADARRNAAYESLDANGKVNMLLREQLEIRKLVETTGEHSIKGAEARVALEKNLTELRKVGLDITKTDAKAQADLADAVDKAVTRTDSVNRKLFKQKLESATLDERLVLLEDEKAKIVATQSQYAKNTTDWKEQQVEINDINKTIEQTRLEIAEKTAAAEANITKNKEKQTRIGFETATQSIFSDTSDATLREIVRRERERVLSIAANTGNITEIISRAGSQQRLAAAQSELDVRKQTLYNASVGGEERARQLFKGDPMEFDKFYSQLTAGVNKDDKIIETLEKTNNLLAGKFRNQ